MSWKKWAAAIAAGLSLCVHAGETQVRDAISAEMRSAYARGDYRAIEDRYASALATSERLPSGLFVAGKIRRSLLPEDASILNVTDPDSSWAPMERKLSDWSAQFPQSSLAAVVLARTYLMHGWSFRGGGYARTVPAGAMAKVEYWTQRAYDTLMTKEKVGRKDPYWYMEMINISRIQGWEPDRFFGLVQEATTAFPQNYDLYFITAMRLEPRWGGSPQAIAGLADYAVRQTRKEEGESLYARIYADVGDELDIPLSDPSVDWKRIKAGFEDILKRYPDNWNVNKYARMACDARDQATSKRLLLQMKGNIEPEAWPDRTTYLRCLQAADLKREDVR
jgi:hypothetical protein